MDCLRVRHVCTVFVIFCYSLSCYLDILYVCYTFAIHNPLIVLIMDTTVHRKQTAFRLKTDLIERLRLEARRENRSLNNLVEVILSEALDRRPNPETMAAIEEARSGKELETLDLEHFDDFIAAL